MKRYSIFAMIFFAVVGGSAHAELSPETTRSMNAAYQRAMDSHDWASAVKYATTDAQRSKAQQQLTKHNEKCANLRVNRDEAYANAKGMGPSKQNKAEAAQAKVKAAGC